MLNATAHRKPAGKLKSETVWQSNTRANSQPRSEAHTLDAAPAAGGSGLCSDLHLCCLPQQRKTRMEVLADAGVPAGAIASGKILAIYLVAAYACLNWATSLFYQIYDKP